MRQRQHLTADIQPIAVLNEDFKTKKVRFIPPYYTKRRGVRLPNLPCPLSQSISLQ
jgi:hypothetical protein